MRRPTLVVERAADSKLCLAKTLAKPPQTQQKQSQSTSPIRTNLPPNEDRCHIFLNSQRSPKTGQHPKAAAKPNKSRFSLQPVQRSAVRCDPERGGKDRRQEHKSSGPEEFNRAPSVRKA